MKDLIFFLGVLGFAALLVMLTMGILGAGVKFWFELLA